MRDSSSVRLIWSLSYAQFGGCGSDPLQAASRLGFGCAFGLLGFVRGLLGSVPLRRSRFQLGLGFTNRLERWSRRASSAGMSIPSGTSVVSGPAMPRISRGHFLFQMLFQLRAWPQLRAVCLDALAWILLPSRLILPSCRVSSVLPTAGFAETWLDLPQETVCGKWRWLS